MSVPMAIALSGQPLLGQPMMVKPSKAEKNLVQSTAAAFGGGLGPYSGGARKLYVGNLPLTIKEEQIRQYARLEDAKLAQNLNGQLEIGSQVINVSAITDQAVMQDDRANVADLDDGEGTVLSLNAHSRALLM